MRQKYTNMQKLVILIQERKTRGETNREIGMSLGLTKKQVTQLITRENRKEKLIQSGYIPRPKGRPRKTSENEEIAKDNAIVRLQMQVDLLRNFLLEAGRR